MPIDHSRVYDSDSILMLDRVPRSLACWRGVALRVHLGLRGAGRARHHGRLARPGDAFLDAELSHELERLWTEFGVEVKHKTRVSKVEPGDRDVLLHLTDGSRLVAEKVLVAAGRWETWSRWSSRRPG